MLHINQTITSLKQRSWIYNFINSNWSRSTPANAINYAVEPEAACRICLKCVYVCISFKIKGILMIFLNFYFVYFVNTCTL